MRGEPVRKLLSFATVVAFLSVLFGAPGTAAAAGYQRWVTILDAPRDMCIGVSGGQMVNGAKVILWQCSGTADQDWVAIPTDPFNQAYYEIKNRKDPSKCLSVPNNWQSPGLQLILWKCQSAAGQLWDVRQLDPLGVQVHNLASDLVIAVPGGRATNGAPIIQWTPSDSIDQTWLARSA